MHKYEEVKDKVIPGLKTYLNCFNKDNFDELEDKLIGLKQSIEESKMEGRVLRIGIVGEVKAGKSSFLNALIFNGEDILPKAATPMTAALTKIGYAKESSAKIVFYTEDDWRIIDNNSRSFDEGMENLCQHYIEEHKAKNTNSSRFINKPMDKGSVEITEEVKRSLEKRMPERLRGCKELTNFVEALNKKGIDVLANLGKELVLSEADIAKGLDDYIGANGKYTPIVKHVELNKDNDDLEGIEIVDTPGMNDPVLSRGQTTKKFLKSCDVIFLLSYCGQFLTAQDVDFMRETLPAEGIKEVIIIGSKLDSGILDEQGDSFVNAYRRSTRLYNDQAMMNINKCLAERQADETLMHLKESMPPSYVSAHLFNCAIKLQDGKALNSAEEHTLNQLKKRFKDFKAEPQILRSISGIVDVKQKKILPVMKKKEEIINEKNQTLVSSNKKAMLKLLDNIQIDAEKNRKSLQEGDAALLQSQYESARAVMDSVKPKLRIVFEEAVLDVKRYVNGLNIDLAMAKDDYTDFAITTREESHDYKYGGICGFFQKTGTRTSIHSVASINDVVQNLDRYILACRQRINEEFPNILNKDKLQKEIIKAIKSALDLKNKNFDSDQIIADVILAINKVSIPKMEIEVEPYENKIVSEVSKMTSGGFFGFGGRKSSSTVEDENIKDLARIQGQVLRNISKDIQCTVESLEGRIENELSEQASYFADKIISDVEVRVKTLQDQMNDREANLANYDKLLKDIFVYKTLVKEMVL